jgi:Uma2 family endonuclease
MDRMVETKRRATADELARMPDDGYRYELLHGELHPMSKPGFRHGLVAIHLGRILREHVVVHDLGFALAAETGFWLANDPDHVRAPDVAFVSKERLAGDPPAGFWRGAPDLAAEVVSPNDSFRDVQEKALDWIRYGTRAVLVVEPTQQSVTVYRSAADVRVLGADDTHDLADVVPGFAVALGDLFRR